MDVTISRLSRLNNALASIPFECNAMLLSELDGFLAGIIVCPELIPPTEWMRFIWVDETADGISAFVDQGEASRCRALVMEHHDAIVRALARGRYEIVLAKDIVTGNVLWGPWIEGFGEAVRLRLESWRQVYLSPEREAAVALTGMMALTEIKHGTSDLDRDLVDQLTEEAPTLIGPAIKVIHAWRTDHVGVPTTLGHAAALPKVGRNDPCPCGSGKKYKKCCG